MSEEGQKKRKFDQSQYEMLLRCSEQKDMTEWNEWRKKNRDDAVFLEGADLLFAHLDSANLEEAHLEGAKLLGAHLEGVELRGARLEGADLTGAHLKGAELMGAHLEGAELLFAHLDGASLDEAHLEGADLQRAHLEGVELMGARLEGADFGVAVVDAGTIIWHCTFDEDTDFTGVGLATARVEPGLKQELEGNIRRLSWLEWYEEHRFLRYPVQLFWLMSDYGRSTGRVLLSFFAWALLFAALYYSWGCWHCLSSNSENPGIVANLFKNGELWQGGIAPIRALYFSIVTMTTLGFGDMYANSESIAGHLIVTLQVLMGYVLLGVLVTRFAVLFTGGGPGKSRTRKKSPASPD